MSIQSYHNLAKRAVLGLCGSFNLCGLGSFASFGVARQEAEPVQGPGLHRSRIRGRDGRRIGSKLDAECGWCEDKGWQLVVGVASDDREGAGGRQASDGDSGRGKVEGVAGRGRRKLAAAGVTVAAGLGPVAPFGAFRLFVPQGIDRSTSLLEEL